MCPQLQYQQSYHDTRVRSPGPSNNSVGASRDLQDKYLTLNHSLKNKLRRRPEDLQLFDPRTGIRKTEVATYNISSKGAQFVESTLQQLMLLAPVSNPVCPQDLQNLCCIQLAQPEWLKDEYAVLIVRSNFDEDTIKWFRQMTKNTSGLTLKH